MDLAGKKVLICVGPSFEDREFIYPFYRFKEAGADVKVAGLGEKTYSGKYGVPVEVDGRYEDFVSQSFDIVVVVGGWAPDKIRMNEAALEIVRKTFKNEKTVAAICHGPWVLASANIIRGKKLTSYRAIKDDMINAGGNWIDSDVVSDSGIVTSRTPADLPAFCREIIRVAQKTKVKI